MEAWKEELYHHGIKGQRWGVRRYQNEDGSLTNAGKKRYGANLDLTDKSKENIAKIRLGEARRRLDTAKSNNSTNTSRIAELKSRERSAKRAVKNAKEYDKGAKRVAKGETISRNNASAYLAMVGTSAAATIASKYVAAYLNSSLANLYANGKYTQNHYAAAEFINKAIPYTIAGLGVAYAAKKYHDNKSIRNYYNANVTGQGTTKAIGSEEYKSVIERSKEK